MAKDWKVVTLDLKTRAPLHEEWDLVYVRPDGWVEVQLIEATPPKFPTPGITKCVKRRYYPQASIIYIEEMGLEKT